MRVNIKNSSKLSLPTPTITNSLSLYQFQSQQKRVLQSLYHYIFFHSLSLLCMHSALSLSLN